MTRPKSGSDIRRTIVDLSWHKGHSVDDGISNKVYLGTEFKLHYPSVDSVCGPGAATLKADISRAFKHIPIDPGGLVLLGLKHNKLHLGLKTQFGYCFRSNFFHRISHSIPFIMNKMVTEVYRIILII